MQLPYHFLDNNEAHLIKDLDDQKLTQSKYYLNFNSDLKEQNKRHPLRMTYTLRGLDTLVGNNGLPLHQVKTEFERYLYNHVPCQRGLVTMPLISRPHLLPIPFPRAFFTSDNIFRLSERGLYQAMPENKDAVMPPLEFLNSLPSLTRTCYDSQYLPNVEKALNNLKTVKPAVRA